MSEEDDGKTIYVEKGPPLSGGLAPSHCLMECPWCWSLVLAKSMGKHLARCEPANQPAACTECGHPMGKAERRDDGLKRYVCVGCGWEVLREPLNPSPSDQGAKQ